MPDFKAILGLISVILGVVAFIPYLNDTLRGKTLPHVYTWFAWGLITLVAFAMQITSGAGAGSWVTLTAALMAFIIFVLGIRKGKKDVTKIDTFFFITALLALFFWIVVKQPTVSAILLVSVGIFSFVPTLRKSWNKPFTETLSTYAINTLRHLISFFALSQYSFLTGFFPVVWGTTNILFVMILIIRRKKFSNFN